MRYTSLPGGGATTGMAMSVSVRTVYSSTIACALVMNCSGVVLYVSVERFCRPYACQYTIMKNMIMHQTNAIAIQVPSTRSSGCFPQSRSAGGSIALVDSCPPGGATCGCGQRTEVQSLLRDWN